MNGRERASASCRRAARYFPLLTVEENLKLASSRLKRDDRYIPDDVSSFPVLQPAGGPLWRRLSGGQQQHLAIGRAGW